MMSMYKLIFLSRLTCRITEYVKLNFIFELKQKTFGDETFNKVLAGGNF